MPYLKPNEEILTEKGLSQQAVAERVRKGLQNTAPEKVTPSNAQIIRKNVFTLFNFFNFLIAVALACVHAYSNIAFLAIIIINICIGIVQEIHAKNLVEELSILTLPKVEVIRDGKQQSCAVEELVQDDVILYHQGQQICADSVVLYGEAEVNELLLTGESDSIVKKPGSHLLSGSLVVSGKCCAQVEHVGLENYAEKLTHDVKKSKAATSRLLQSMRKVTRFTGFFIIPLGILLFIEAFYFRMDALAPSVVTTSAGLLGMLPKGLVLLISITLASGVVKLSQKNVLVQDLFSLESLAYADILCLDKTGTITEGKMTVESVDDLGAASLPVSFQELMQSFLYAADDSNATFQAMKAYFHAEEYFEATGKIPFSSERKWSSVTFAAVGSLVIGAPERLSKELLPEKIMLRADAGARILLVGFTAEQVEKEKLPPLLPVAYLTISDPVKADAPETLAFFEKEGVAVKIISGDSTNTAAAVAKQAGLKNYLSAVDMSAITEDEQIEKAAQEYSVFGRVSPLQKKKLVHFLQQKGKTAAMIGDGVNDVLALREADCSIAMANGSEAARQISQLVLLDSDFMNLPHVLAQGRRAVNNVTKVAGIFFVKTLYSVLLSILCMFLNMPFPFIPIQITLIDLFIEGYPSFFMSFEPDNHKITESFLHSSFRRALPNALTILAEFVLVMLLLPMSGQVSSAEAASIFYLLVGFTEMLAVYKASVPVNKLHIFLCVSMTLGFFAAVCLFGGILQLAPLALVLLPLVGGLFVAAMLLERGFRVLIDHVFWNKKA